MLLPASTPNQAGALRTRCPRATDANRLSQNQPSGRLSVPYVLLYYLPITCNSELRMLYAGAKELMRSTSEAGRVLDLESIEDLDEIPKKLSVE